MSRRTMIVVVVAVVAAVAAVVAVVALALAADDSASPGEYRTSVATARDRTDEALEHITLAQSREDLIERMDEAAIVIERAADNLDEADPVAEVEDTHTRLVAALRQLSTDVAGTAEQLREPGFDDILEGTRAISFGSFTQVNVELGELRRNGIAVRPLEFH